MKDPSFAGEDVKAPSTSSSTRGLQARSCSRSNVFQLLAHREVCPRTKRSLRKLWVEDTKGTFEPKHQKARDARRDLFSWIEAESLLHLSSTYCPLLPPPRSTIAAAFSPDGKRLASTHGDHTVKIIDCQTGSCLKVLSGHRRTPWVVRFHPLYPEILASGSLDHEVRLWDATTAECIGSRDFYRPIASIAFHAQGELLAVASGHKLFIWHYNGRGEASSPTIILKTRRSLRAVHFHPHGAPFLLTAEVSDLEPSDSSMTLATSRGDLRYPPPTVYLADAQAIGRSSLSNELPIVPLPYFIWPSVARENARTAFQHTDCDGSLNEATQRDNQSSSVRLLTYSTPTGQYELVLSPADTNNSSSQQEETGNNPLSNETGTEVSHSATEAMETMEDQQAERSNRYFSFGDPTSWEPPFMHGWLVGQAQVGQRTMRQPNNVGAESSLPTTETGGYTSLAPSLLPTNVGQSSSAGRSTSRHRSSRSRLMPSSGYVEGSGYNTIMREGNDLQLAISRVSSEVATSLAAAAELPCTVKLRIWSHDVKDSCAPLDPERCRLTIPHAVLCSEMGAHFSPCGRFLAACVACILPHVEGDHGLQGHLDHDRNGAATSPTRHPVLAQTVMYELRIYSLEEATFGSVLASRAIRAAHCLTSIQFSPTSEHLLLAYGRRHGSLLKSLVIDGETTVPIYTILEVYRVSDMELVRVLPSAEDEVNVASFHPSIGGGLIYGTKEGKLRILQYDSSLDVDHANPSFMDENMMEVSANAQL